MTTPPPLRRPLHPRAPRFALGLAAAVVALAGLQGCVNRSDPRAFYDPPCIEELGVRYRATQSLTQFADMLIYPFEICRPQYDR